MGVLFPEADTLELYAELELALPRTHPCAIRRLCSCAESLDSVSRHSDGSRCSLTVEGAPADRDGARVEQVEQPCHDGQCYYEVLDRCGVRGDIVGVTEDGVRIEAYLRSRELIAEVVDDLSAIGNVTVRKLSRTDRDSDVSDLRRIDFGVLTPLERETLRYAVESGYYDEPRRTSLNALADAFGVSKGTLSQRLSAAERKLVLESVPGESPGSN